MTAPEICFIVGTPKETKTLDQLHENSVWNKHEVFLLGIIWALSVSESAREGKQTS